MTLVSILQEIESRVTNLGYVRCVDLQPDGKQPQREIIIRDAVTGELVVDEIVTLAGKYFAKFNMALPAEVMCDVLKKSGALNPLKQIIYVIDADQAFYGSSLIKDYDPNEQVIPKSDKWFGVMQNMISAGIIDSWRFKNTEQVGLDNSLIANLTLIKNGTAINLDGTPADSQDGVISVWEDKDGNMVQIFRSQL
jgi:hypothetical protein